MTTILDIPGTNPLNPFSTPIQALLTTTNPSSTPEETAAHLVTSELWDAFFTAVTTSTTHTPHLALLDTLRAQPPTQPTNVRTGSDAQRQLRSYTGADGKLYWAALPRFSAQWRDVHDILEAWRDWDGVRDSSSSTTSTLNGGCSGADYFLRFCTFSAALLKATSGKGEVLVHPVWVFYVCRDVLECEHEPQPSQPKAKAHRIPPEQVWALDVRVAATWVRDGGLALWEADQEELRRHWAAALDEMTELWPREDGLTRERWQLWERRLRELSTEEKLLDGDTRAVVAEAAEVVSGLLKGNDRPTAMTQAG
ncbi:hypothetical protein CDV55_102636 [Aspergillus turcosus]|uniref:Uncharacterized protein n=1 Tax=Aspergillus turcosus TaxID=1245748 RepID=A0A229XBA7_9EURO|nr:hypothetical protein CDV55_102636 [Aspergillus turcosus]RLL96678.1 hypothetical protein CFD26_106417 [Aspergillus turcosus]